MKVVSDAGPILSFARAGRLEILRQVVGELIIPEAVVEELVVGGKGKPGAEEIERGKGSARRTRENGSRSCRHRIVATQERKMDDPEKRHEAKRDSLQSIRHRNARKPC